MAGTIIRHRLKCQKLLFKKLLPVAEERCRERDFPTLGHKYQKHVRTQRIWDELLYELICEGRLYSMDYGDITKAKSVVSKKSRT